jgi:drug/metabolite transporter (DMT)-like permease
MSVERPLIGVAAMALVVAIYSANLVVSRFSVLHGLRAWDLAALRYLVSGVVLLPSLARMGWRDLGGLGWPRGIVLACLAGAPYMVALFHGLSLAPSAHAAVLNPGIVPSVVFLGMVALRKRRLTPVHALLLVLIAAGVALLTGASFSTQRPVLLGDAVLLATGISWGLFTLLARVWELRPMQAATIVSVLSLAYLPPYLLFRFRGFAVPLAHVLAQAAFQGLINSIAALYLLTFAVRHLGAIKTSLFSPAVPVVTAVGATLVGERPGGQQTAGIVMVVAAMIGAAVAEARAQEPR